MNCVSGHAWQGPIGTQLRWLGLASYTYTHLSIRNVYNYVYNIYQIQYNE